MQLNRTGIAWSAAIHAAVLSLVVFGGVIGGCRVRRQRPESIDFTIAVDALQEEAEEAPAPKVDAKPPIPPKPDDIAPPKPPKKDPPKKDPPKKQPQKKDPPKKQPPKKIEKGRRVTKKIDSPVKPRERQTLSDAEIEKWLGRRAKIGDHTSLPDNEVSLNVAILKNCLYDAWMPPPRSSSGVRPAIVVFGVGGDGSLLSPKISVSSGSAAYDASCVDAVIRVGRIPELTKAFIRAYGANCEVEFKEKQ